MFGLLALLGVSAAAWWFFARQPAANSIAPSASTENAPSTTNVPSTTNAPAPPPSPAAPPSAPAPPASGVRPATRRMLVLRLDIHVNGVEQALGGVDRAWIRARIDPVVRDLVPDAQREVSFPAVPTPSSGVQEIDAGFRVVVAWPLAAGLEPTEAQLATWRTWIETRLRRSENGSRIHDVRLYTRDAA